MGGFYGSLQLRTEDRDEVLPHLEALARASGHRFLCGPPLGGWVGVYPSNNGQDESDATALSERWPGELFYLLVHDDDVFAYRYFRAGKLVDAYWSKPGYFGEENRRQEEAQAGEPETYSPLLRGSVARARAVLERSGRHERTLEHERLRVFAKLLGVTNAVTAYEYLDGGERRGIRGWKDFVHVPDRADERQAAALAKTARLRQFKQWVKEGLLLAAQDLPAQRIRGPGGAVVMEVGERSVAVDFDDPHVVPHPLEPFTVTGRGCHLDIGSSEGTLRLLVGEQDAWSARGSDRTLELLMLCPTLMALPPGQALSLLLRYVAEEHRDMVESHVRAVLPPAPWSQQQAMFLTQLVGRAMSRAESAARVAFSADGRWLLCGTSRGLCVAAWADVRRTAEGARVPWKYRYEVPPRQLGPNPSHGFVYAIVHDARADLVLFSGMDGRIRTLSLLDGRVENLLDVHGRSPVMRMTWLDASTLAVYAQPGFPGARRTKGPRPIVYLWNYDAVRARAESGGRPADPPLEAHALVPLASGDLPPSPIDQVLQGLRASHARTPKEIHLEPFEADDWPEKEALEVLVAPLLDAGFEAGGAFIVRDLAGMRVQFFARAGSCLAARLTWTREQGTRLTLSSERSDGSTFSVTNRPSLGLDLHPDHTIRHLVGADARRLLDVITRTRPDDDGPWVPMTLADLPGRFERLYREGRAWREARGFSESEASRFVLARSRVPGGG